MCLSSNSFSWRRGESSRRQPFVVARPGNAQHPAGHRDVESRRRRVHGPAGRLLWENVLPGEVRGRPLEDLDFHLQPPLVPAQLGEFLLLLARQLRSRCRARRRRPGPSSSADTTRRSAAPSPARRPVWSPARASSTARRRNSGGWGAGTTTSFPVAAATSGQVSGLRGEAHMLPLPRGRERRHQHRPAPVTCRPRGHHPRRPRGRPTPIRSNTHGAARGLHRSRGPRRAPPHRADLAAACRRAGHHLDRHRHAHSDHIDNTDAPEPPPAPTPAQTVFRPRRPRRPFSATSAPTSTPASPTSPTPSRSSGPRWSQRSPPPKPCSPWPRCWRRPNRRTRRTLPRPHRDSATRRHEDPQPPAVGQGRLRRSRAPVRTGPTADHPHRSPSLRLDPPDNRDGSGMSLPGHPDQHGMSPARANVGA